MIGVIKTFVWNRFASANVEILFGEYTLPNEQEKNVHAPHTWYNLLIRIINPPIILISSRTNS